MAEKGIGSDENADYEILGYLFITDSWNHLGFYRIRSQKINVYFCAITMVK
jgi:hypothetical protein